jgi:HCOMODA/2-hydroxy-3-carboxy-muconic semialdehyde decarboxylase
MSMRSRIGLALFLAFTCAGAAQAQSPELAGVDAALIDDLVAANRILANEKVLDGFGHVSVRDPRNPSRYLISRSVAPALVTANDILLADLDSNVIDAKGRGSYKERFIHGEIYKARPDVHSVVHCHTPSLVTFCVCRTPLRPLYHMSGFLGGGVARFEIREVAGMTDMLCSTPALGAALARSIADKQIVLMRGHGATMAGQSIKHAVYRAIYAALNATMQMDAMRMGEVTYLADEEARKGMEINDRFVDRSWSLWKLEAMGAG